MGWFCCVPGCSKRSERDKDVSFHLLPRHDKKLLKLWIHKIGRKDLRVSASTRVCSRHFVSSKNRKLRPDEYPTLNLPTLSTQVTQQRKRKSPRKREFTLPTEESDDCSGETEAVNESVSSVATSTDVHGEDIEALVKECELLRRKLVESESKLKSAQLRISSVEYDDKIIQFYIGFTSYKLLKACFDFLGPAVENLNYWGQGKDVETNNDTLDGSDKSSKGRHRTLCPIDEFFLVMIRLRLGLLEKDLAYRFGMSQSTVSRILITWINFLYLQFQYIPFWPSKEMIVADMPESFRRLYPSTRVILDATEVRVEKPGLPNLQQATFSNYKNTNTYKVLIGISPSGVITFVSSCMQDQFQIKN